MRVSQFSDKLKCGQLLTFQWTIVDTKALCLSKAPLFARPGPFLFRLIDCFGSSAWLQSTILTNREATPYFGKASFRIPVVSKNSSPHLGLSVPARENN